MADDAGIIKETIRDSINNMQKLIENETIMHSVSVAADAMIRALTNEGRILFCGNGGSAAQAQHFSAELSGKFMVERDPFDAEALHVNTSFLTAVANDYGYSGVYARLVRAKGRPGDVLVGITTSGNSPNIVHAFKSAHEIKMYNIGMTGEGGGDLAALSDILIAVPSKSTPRIQECHLLLGHILCERVEEACSRKITKK